MGRPASHRPSPFGPKSTKLKPATPDQYLLAGDERVKSRRIALVAAAAASVILSAAPSLAQSIKAYRHIILDGHRVKWGSPTAGTGALVTYATVETEQKFPGARNCTSMAPIAPLLASNGITAAAFDKELRTAFALWSVAANIRFEPADDPAAADILIGAQAEPRGRAFTNIEYEANGSTAIRRLTRSLICLNPEERWKTGFDGNLAVYDLRYALLHEIGHAIGLNHPSIANQLMDFRYLERFRTPQAGDVAGAVALYGPSPAGTAAAAGEAPRLANARSPLPDLGG